MKAARYLCAILIVCALLAGLYLFLRHRRPGKVILMAPMTFTGWDGAGHRFLSRAHFRLAPCRSTTEGLLQRLSVKHEASWHYTVFTNDMAGNFMRAFEANVGSFSPQEADRGEFYILGDERLLYTKWMLRVTRSGKHQLPRPFSSLIPSVSGATEIWVSEPIPAAVEEVFELPFASPPLRHHSEVPSDREEPRHLTNGRSLFGPYQFQLTPD